MVKKIISTIVLICLLISMFPIGAFSTDTVSNDATSPAVTVQVEKVNSWLLWLIDLISGHGYEDWYRDNYSSKDYNYSNSYFQIIKVNIRNISDSDIIFDEDNQLVLQFKNNSGKELGLKMYGFTSYQNLDKSTRNYSFGSTGLAYKKLKKGETWELYGYTKWMNYSDLSCTILSQPQISGINVRLTERNNSLGNPADNYAVDRIGSSMKLYNEGDKELDLNKVRIHYYFNLDGDPTKVAPKAEKIEGKVYNYQAGRSNPYEYVINRLPYAFINMGEFASSKANTFIEIGFPSTKTSGSYYTYNHMYRFLKDYNNRWHSKYIKLDSNWLSDLLGFYNSGFDNKKHRWWWSWDNDYTKSSMDYKLSPKSSKGTSYVTVDLEIIKEILSGVTGDTSGLRKFYQGNHYSFNTGREIDWEKVTVYYDGKLVWGKEPGISLAAPVNLSAIAKNDGILLKWDEVPNAEGYQIFRKGPGDTDYLQIPVTNTENSYIDKLVTPGETYYYKVKAVSEDGEPGPESASVSATALKLTGNGLYAEYYNWKEVPGSTLTNYDFDSSNGFATNYVVTNTELALTRIDPKIDFTKDNTNTYYKWGTIAPDPKVNPNYYTVVWNGYLVPKYSEGYTISTNTDDGVRFWLDLNNNGVFESTELYIDNWTKHAATENSSTISNLIANKKYKIKMEYFENSGDAVAQLMWSSSKQKKEVIPTSQLYLDNDALIPEKPGNLSAVLIDEDSVQLSWNKVLNADGYKIYQTDKNGNTVEFVVLNDNKYTITGLQVGDYTYSVSAINERGESEKSDAVSIRVGLSAPTNLSAELAEKAVLLTWDKVTGATGYRIKRICDGVETILPDCNTNQFSDTSIVPGKVYSYTVTALKNDMEGARSEPVAVLIPALAPTKLSPELLMNTVKLKWAAGQGAQSYNILRSTEPNGGYTTIATGITQTEYVDTSVVSPTDKNGKKYYYVVVSVFNGIVSKNSNIAEVTLYPYVETDLGLLRYNIISKPGTVATDFVLGSYVPVVVELKLNSNTVNPTFKIDRELDIPGANKPFVASIVSMSGTKVYLGERKITSFDIVDNTTFRINGSYSMNDVLRVEFAVKISAKDEFLKAGIKSYYNKYCKLRLGLMKMGMEDYIYRDILGRTLELEMKVLQPDKLN